MFLKVLKPLASCFFGYNILFMILAILTVLHMLFPEDVANLVERCQTG